MRTEKKTSRTTRRLVLGPLLSLCQSTKHTVSLFRSLDTCLTFVISVVVFSGCEEEGKEEERTLKGWRRVSEPYRKGAG